MEGSAPLHYSCLSALKTTSYEISKKLKEAGFEAEADYYFYGQQLRNSAFPSHSTDADRKVHVKSYDLETLLDALPDSITKEYKSKEDGEIKEFKERLIIEKEEIRYSCDDIENADDANLYYQEYGYMQDISVFKKFNDNSLADVAGKMWLMLKEKGIV